MNILLATGNVDGGPIRLALESLQFNCTTVRIDSLLKTLGDPTTAPADFIILDPPAFDALGNDRNRFIIQLATLIRGLDKNVAMYDGRRWSAIPIGCYEETDLETLVVEAMQSVNVTRLSSDPAVAREQLTHAVDRYRKHLIDNFANLGFHVSEHNGIITVDGLTVELRRRADSEYYTGSKDLRLGRRFVLRRDPAKQADHIDTFMELINKKGVKEETFQDFFEAHPDFLTLGMKELIPHGYLPFSDTADYSAEIPDFMLRPIVPTTISRDSDYEVLDIKRPDARIIVGTGRRSRLSADVTEGIAQMRDYGKYFQNPEHEKEIARTLGRPVKHPRKGLIIGRTPNEEDLPHLDEQQSYNYDVHITTYDEILDRQINLLPPT